MTQTPGRDDRPPGLVDDRVVLERVLDQAPHEIALGSPRPRKVMNVSAKIAYAISSTVFAIRSGVTCGRTWRRIRRELRGAERPSPLDVDALPDALRLRAQRAAP